MSSVIKGAKVKVPSEIRRGLHLIKDAKDTRARLEHSQHCESGNHIKNTTKCIKSIEEHYRYNAGCLCDNRMTITATLKQLQHKNKLRTNTISAESSYIIMQHK